MRVLLPLLLADPKVLLARHDLCQHRSAQEHLPHTRKWAFGIAQQCWLNYFPPPPPHQVAPPWRVLHPQLELAQPRSLASERAVQVQLRHSSIPTLALATVVSASAP